VVAQWVETGQWWQSRGVHEVLGEDQPGATTTVHTDLATDREVWRVEAGRGAVGAGHGVFDLAFDWADGSWHLTRCLD
jgi:hypothetical protein